MVLLQLKDHPLTQPDAGLDTTAYVDLARRVLAGDIGLGPGLYFVSPLYIYFVAACLAIFRSFTALRLVQIALGAVSVGFIFLMTRAWFGARASWIAAVLAALTGLFTFYEVLILQSSLDAFLTSAALYALTRGLLPPKADLPPKGGSYTIVLAGVIFGVQTLNRPNVLIAALAMALVMAIALRRLRPAALLVAGLTIGMAPVAIRNVVVAHQWTLVSSHGGLNFYIGNNEHATGFYTSIPGITPTIVGQQDDARRVAARALGRPETDAEASDYFFGLGRAWIAEHPAAAAALFVKKFVYVFSAAHIPLPHSYPFYAYDLKTVLRFYAIGPWLLIPLGLVGLVFAGPVSARGGYLAWASFVPAYAASVAVFFVAERYRLPVLVPLCVGAGAAIDLALRAVSEGRYRTLGAPAMTATALGAVVNWPLHTDDGRWQEGLRLAQALAIHHRDDEARDWALRLDRQGPPHPGAGEYGLGAQWLALNEPARALSFLEAAHRADPGNATVDYAFGQALLKTGRAADALPHLAHGFTGNVDLPGGGLDYAVALRDTGNFPAAADAIRRIVPADSEDAEAWLRLGRLAMEVHAPAVAEPFFRRGVAMQPGDAAARQQLGLNLLVLSRCDQAARELAEAIRLDPRDPDSLAHLAYCEIKLGRADDARRHVDAALAADAANPLARQLAAALR